MGGELRRNSNIVPSVCVRIDALVVNEGQHHPPLCTCEMSEGNTSSLNSLGRVMLFFPLRPELQFQIFDDCTEQKEQNVI